MKTLEQFNEDKYKEHETMEESMKPHPNAISCPQCKNELWDSDPMVVLTSYPAKKNVHCPACGYRGYRLA